MNVVVKRIVAGLVASLFVPLVMSGADGKPGISADNVINSATSPVVPVLASDPGPPPAVALKPVADPLLQLLISKGVLSAAEASSLTGSSTAELHDSLALLLRQKGILSNDDLSALKVKTPAVTMVAGENLMAAATPQTTGPANPQVATKPLSPTGPIPAVAPVRVLQMDPAKREGFIPDLKVGPVRVKPYGFFKTTLIHDSASPYGNDFPLPGFIGDINGPDSESEFHIKARSLRIGSNFEWLDLSPKVVVTGKFEMDFEGNFTRVNNRNISSVRSSQPSIRLGYGRIDYLATDKTSAFLLAGQDWTPFGSSTLPSLLESTGLGLGFGTLYERDPQFRFGLNRKLGGSRNFAIGPEVALVLPAFGNVPGNLCSAPAANGATTVSCSAANPALSVTGVESQLGLGERQGADSGRPEIQTRLVMQFQLDNAKGVAPAQIVFSGMQGERSAVVLASEIPAAFRSTFTNGARLKTSRYGYTAEMQLPTRFATLVAKYYNGEDLRFYFAGQLLPEFNDTLGLTGVATAPSVDGASTVAFGLRGGVPVLAQQRPPRSQGGFLNLGVPLSRLMSADPSGRNAGWTMYLHYGYDQVLARDVRRIGGGREKSQLVSGQMQYKLNNFITFAVEESLYRTTALPNAAGTFPLFRGVQTRQLDNIRSEVGTIFNF